MSLALKDVNRVCRELAAATTESPELVEQWSACSARLSELPEQQKTRADNLMTKTYRGYLDVLDTLPFTLDDCKAAAEALKTARANMLPTGPIPYEYQCALHRSEASISACFCLRVSQDQVIVAE